MKLARIGQRLETLNTSKATPLASSLGFSNGARGTRHERGYGSAWDKLRKLVIKRDGYQCQECKRQGMVTPGQDVDHIVNKANGGTDMLSNLQYLCRACHKDKTARESNEGRT